MTKTIERALLKRRAANEDRHWLGEGINGQDSLLIDLDPFLYAADHIISKRATQVAFRFDQRGEKPVAMVIPSPDGIPWHLAYLSKRFDTCLLVPEFDPLLSDVCEAFDVSLFVEECPQTLFGSVQFAVVPFHEWASKHEILNTVRLVHELSSGEGRACIILRTEKNPDAPESSRTVSLGMGGHIPLEDLLRSREFCLFADVDVTHAPLADVKQTIDFGIAEFAKRNREFFGKGARDICLARLYEEDFQRLLDNSALDGITSTVITLYSQPEEKSAL